MYNGKEFLASIKKARGQYKKEDVFDMADVFGLPKGQKHDNLVK